MFPIEVLETVEKKRLIRRVIFGGIAVVKYEVVKDGFRPHGRAKVFKDETACIFVAIADVQASLARQASYLGHVAASVAAFGLSRSKPPRPYVEEGVRRYVGYEKA